MNWSRFPSSQPVQKKWIRNHLFKIIDKRKRKKELNNVDVGLCKGGWDVASGIVTDVVDGPGRDVKITMLLARKDSLNDLVVEGSYDYH